MARKVESISVGAGIRTASEELIKKMRKSGFSKQIIDSFRLILKQFGPFGNLFRNAIRVWANRLDPKLLALIEPWLEALSKEVDIEETDMNKRRKVPDNRGKVGAGLQGGIEAIARATAKISNLGKPFSEIIEKHIAGLPTLQLQELVLLTLSLKNENALKEDASKLEILGDKADLLKMLHLSGTAEAKAAAGDSEGNDAATTRKLLKKLRDKNSDAWKKIQGLMASSANDSIHDRPAFECWVASFLRLGEDEAVAELEAIAEQYSIEELARIAGVRPNYVTKATSIFPKIGKFFGGISESSCPPETSKQVLARYNRYRKGFGLKLISR